MTCDTVHKHIIFYSKGASVLFRGKVTINIADMYALLCEIKPTFQLEY